ncbi:hypothetical protein NCCP2222_22160 [Sporosarcina sp. NCCP-2222]|nr:hypothetical protein NCCP2222_22160 [Sporosarcina sp. NCCP-2222]
MVAAVDVTLIIKLKYPKWPQSFVSGTCPPETALSLLIEEIKKTHKKKTPLVKSRKREAIKEIAILFGYRPIELR